MTARRARRPAGADKAARGTARPAELEQAIRLFEQGRYAEALAGFKACVRSGTSAEVREYLEKAARHLAHGAVGVRADPSLSRALEARDFAAAGEQARRLFAADRRLAYRALRDHFLKGVEGVPESAEQTPWGCFFAASQAWKHGRTLEALRLIARGASGGEEYAWMRYYAAELLMRRADLYAPALAQIDEAARSCPWLWEAQFLRAELRWTLGERDALRGLDALSLDGPSRSALLAWRGALELWTGQTERALADLDQAAALGNPDAPCWRGGVLVLSGRLEEAEAGLTGLLRRDPTDHEARVWRAEAYRRLGRPADCAADAAEALSRAEGNVWALVNRALARLSLGDVDGAREDAARLGPPGLDGFFEANPSLSRLDSSMPGYWFALAPLEPAALRELLEQALAAARGCRRWDPHLNLAWMRRAGAAVPERPAPVMRLRPWLAARGVPVPPDTPFGPETITPERAAEALSRARAS